MSTVTSERQVILFEVEDIIMVVQTLGVPEILPWCFKNFRLQYSQVWGFPGGSAVKNRPANARDSVSTPGLERSPGEGNGNPLQYSCLENPVDKEAWRATVHGITESQTELSY